MNQEQIVDSWIDEEELPSRANLKPIGRFDDLYPEDAEEREAYWDFMHWYLSQDFLPLLGIPKPVEENDFWTFEGDDSISFPFSSMDYQRLHPFNKYAYKLKKIYERVKDLALLHSCIRQKEGKQNACKKFSSLVGEEFRAKCMMLLESYRKYPHLVNKTKLFKRIAELNGRIQKCEEIWKRYAYWE